MNLGNLISEQQLQDAIADLARTYGWMVAHFRPAKTEKGWRTAGQYDAVGFPDLTLAKGGTVAFIECKSTIGSLSEDQRQWFSAIFNNGKNKNCFYMLARPVDWEDGTIEGFLKEIDPCNNFEPLQSKSTGEGVKVGG
ncbi:MAG: VRR-NUC domain-containing protein [Dehalococcoidia bacterium]|nr:VRR-NUC domain-containing protein [Dehalococcoidia bacterium]